MSYGSSAGQSGSLLLYVLYLWLVVVSPTSQSSPPWFTISPSSQCVNPGDNATIYAELQYPPNDLTAPWLRYLLTTFSNGTVLSHQVNQLSFTQHQYAMTHQYWLSIGYWLLANEYWVFSIHQWVSCIEYLLSVEYRVLSIEYRVSSIYWMLKLKIHSDRSV